MQLFKAPSTPHDGTLAIRNGLAYGKDGGALTCGERCVTDACAPLAHMGLMQRMAPSTAWAKNVAMGDIVRQGGMCTPIRCVSSPCQSDYHCGVRWAAGAGRAIACANRVVLSRGRPRQYVYHNPVVARPT